MEIVGIVNDVRDRTLKVSTTPVYFRPLAAYDNGFQIIARTSANPMAMAPAIARAVQAIDRDARISDPQTLNRIISKSVAEPKFQTLLVGSFGILGSILAIVGLWRYFPSRCEPDRSQSGRPESWRPGRMVG